MQCQINSSNPQTLYPKLVNLEPKIVNSKLINIEALKPRKHDLKPTLVVLEMCNPK